MAAQHNPSPASRRWGFTLVELLIVFSIISGISSTIYFAATNPKIVERAKDAQRMRDIGQIKQGLELFYQDHNCYPTASSPGFASPTGALTTGGEWSEGGQIYIKKTPKDPATFAPYIYNTDSTSNCPQWAEVFSKLAKTPARFTACSIPSYAKIPACAPSGVDFQDPTWACTSSGSVSCNVPIPTAGPTPTGFVPTSGPTPTPTILANLVDDTDHDGYCAGSPCTTSTQTVTGSAVFSGRTYYKSTTSGSIYKYLVLGTQLGANDCNVSNKNVYQNLSNLFLDQDYDGYTTGSASTVCVGSSLNSNLATGLVGQWNMNETSGTTVSDTSGASNTGIAVGGSGIIAGQTGLGNARSLSGADGQFIQVNNAASLNPAYQITVAGWFKVNSLAKSWQSIFWKGNAPDCTQNCENRQYALWLENTGVLHLTSTTVNNIGLTQYFCDAPSGIITAGPWYHFAAILDSYTSVMSIYVNGVLKTNCQGYYSNTGIRKTTGAFMIGDNPTSDTALNGAVDEYRIYNRALQQSEVLQLYTSNTISKPYYKNASGTAYILSSDSIDTGECADADSSKWQNLTGYADNDSDGTGAGAGSSMCLAGSFPTGFSYSTTDTDCLDSNANVYKTLANGVTDADQDGYYTGVSSSQCVGMQSSAAVNTGRIGFWRFEDTGSFIYDSTNNGNNGTTTGTTFVAGGGAFGSAARSFNGSSDQVDMGTTVGNFAKTDPFSVSAWVKASVLGGINHGIVGRTSASGYVGWHLRITGGNTARFILSSDGSNYAGADSTVLSTNTWYHLVGTWDGTTAKVYVNGALNSTPLSGGTIGTITGSRPLYVGYDPATASYFNGIIDEIQMYNRALSATEVPWLQGSNGVYKYYYKDASGNASKMALSDAIGGSDCNDNNAGIYGACVAPSITNVTISPKPISSNGSSQYAITFTGNDGNGGADIGSELVMINYQGANAGQYRGYVGWSNIGFPNWQGFYKAGTPIACTGGGSGAIYSPPAGYETYGPGYINLVSCSTSVSDNTRISTLNVTFNSSFNSPITGNTLSGFIQDVGGLNQNLAPFDTFNLNCTNGYLDQDIDGYGAGAFGCYAGSVVASNTDCYDLNANAKPGQTNYFPTNRGDGSFDYNCDGSETLYYSSTYTADVQTSPCVVPFYADDGYGGTYLSCTGSGASCYVPSSTLSTCGSPLTCVNPFFCGGVTTCLSTDSNRCK